MDAAEIVFFGEHYEKRPDLFGAFCVGPEGSWISLPDILRAVGAGRTVKLRPPSESELKRADTMIALASIGEEIAQKVGQLLDQQPAAMVTEAILDVHRAVSDLDVHFDLLDQGKVQ